MKRLKVALLGAGRIGRIHAKNILFDSSVASLVAVYDPKADLSWAFKDGVKNVNATLADLARDREIDALIIAAPTDQHLELTQVFLKAGKHIFCEKPVEIAIAAQKSLEKNMPVALGTH